MARYRNLPDRYAAPPPRYVPPPKKAEDFYQSKEWRRLVARLKRERGAWCQRCGSTHRVTGDHIQELKDGGAPLDPANVELLCQACHNTKTAKARARRVGLAQAGSHGARRLQGVTDQGTAQPRGGGRKSPRSPAS
ncbi:HNH endonuclease [Amaricoccus sp. HAR-UPW-R2A-40]|nr:HNH endonuclease [Amaricoccus sp. HAR-UPW-R2A-40]